MPVTISPRDFERWLDSRSDEIDPVLPLMASPRIGEFAWHPVSSRVNRVANDDEQLLLPISAEEMDTGTSKPKKPARKAAGASPEDGQGSLF